MDQIRRVMETIRSAYETLKPTHKLLALSLATVLGMTLFLVSQYSTRADMVPLIDASYSAQDQAAAASYLDVNGITHSTAPDGAIMVPAGERRRIISGMAEEGRLPGDTSLLFNNLIDKHSWTWTSNDKDRAYQLALQNELSMALSGWDSISKATVILNLPKTRSIGRPATAPSASVTIVKAGDFNQARANSVASFIAGASRGLSVERVRVSDSTGRQYKAASDDAITATTTQELIAQIELRQQNKIYDWLSPQIPGVMVAVMAQVDATRRNTTREAMLPDGEGSGTLLVDQNRINNENSGPANGGSPGAQANTQASISTGSGAGTMSTESNSKATFVTKFGTEVQQVLDPRGFATKINAVVNVPRTYFAQIWRMEETRRALASDGEPPAEDADPTDDQISAVRDAELARLQQEVKNLIDTETYDGALPGDVSVSMMPLPPMSLIANNEEMKAGFLGIGAGGADGGGVGGAIKTLGLGGLAVLALGLMVFTALKANKTEDLPTAEELVGIPRALDTEDEIIGEADGMDPPLEGIEITDEEMHKKRMASQVGEVVRERPDDAARILSQWISSDE